MIFGILIPFHDPAAFGTVFFDVRALAFGAVGVVFVAGDGLANITEGGVPGNMQSGDEFFDHR